MRSSSLTTLYKNYRTQMAGLTAQMWQAKCYEEQGKIGEAIGIYKSLLDQPDPRLRPLQRFVGYFYIVALSKRKDHALAADEAVRLAGDLLHAARSAFPEGLGVLLELAKNIDAQMAESTDRRPSAAGHQEDRRRGLAGCPLHFAVQGRGPGPAEEVQADGGRQGRGACQADLRRRLWARPTTPSPRATGSGPSSCSRRPIRKVDPRRDIDKANRAQVQPGILLLHEQAILRSQRPGRAHRPALSPGGAFPEGHRDRHAGPGRCLQRLHRGRPLGADLERLIDLAKYTAATWPDREQGDDAHMNLGLIYQGRGQYDQAITEFAAVRERSPKKIEAQTRLGGAHWAKSRMLDRRGDKEKAAAAEAKLGDRPARQVAEDPTKPPATGPPTQD